MERVELTERCKFSEVTGVCVELTVRCKFNKVTEECVALPGPQASSLHPLSTYQQKPTLQRRHCIKTRPLRHATSVNNFYVNSIKLQSSFTKVKFGKNLVKL